MEKYKVTVSAAAQRDFLGIIEYIDTLPPEEALQHYEQILEDTEVLRDSPLSCPFTRDLQLRLRGYRILTVEDYLFFFVVSSKVVEVRRILYAKRQYDRLV